MAEPRHFNVPDDAAVGILQRMTSVQRCAVASDSWMAMRNSIECRVRSEHHDWAAEQLKPEIARPMEPAEYYPSSAELAAYLHNS
jgi:hypothetical protein